jgi:hypothetical protein
LDATADSHSCRILVYELGYLGAFEVSRAI